MIKARRPEDPRNYVLVEEHGGGSGLEVIRSNKFARTLSTRHRRILADEENVYETQMQWKTDPGMLILSEKARIQEVYMLQPSNKMKSSLLKG